MERPSHLSMEEYALPAAARLSYERVEVNLLGAALRRDGVHLPMLRNGLPERQAIVCRLFSKEGPAGEAYLTVLGVDGALVVKWLCDKLVPLLPHLDFSSPERCWDVLFSATRHEHFTRHVGLRAIALLDCAIWDLKGKSLNQSLARYWKADQSELQMLVLCSSVDPVRGVRASSKALEDLLDAGYAGVKLKVGSQSGLSVQEDIGNVLDVRSLVGDEVHLIADANQAWSLDEAVEFAQGVRSARLTWIEEPCHWEADAPLIARFRDMTSASVAAGQMESTVHGCHRLMIEGNIDICNFDASLGGGATPWRRMVEHARSLDREVVHHTEPQVGLALAAASGIARFAEVFEAPVDPFFPGLIANLPPLRNGAMQLPDGPGWGWHYDTDFLKNATRQSWAW